MNDNQFLVVLLLVVAAIYIISPLDLVPGPIDDLLVAVLAFFARKRLTAKEESE